ncbi:hypothetical protein ABI59_18295 [Acidobacteria bacterium Mor1]|nr:hypothetical protein ABI59_18295 [Acidobacteria bacterium Mor1]
MKGVVFNLFEAFVVENWGEETYWKLVDACSLETSDGVFVGPGTYPDADLFTLVTKASEMLEVPAIEAIRAFGKFCLPHLMDKAGPLVEDIPSAKELLKQVDSVIHVEVRKMYPGAVTPVFRYEDTGPDRLILEYRSNRKLCAFVEGLIEGAGDHYDTKIEYEHGPCMHHGSDHCSFSLRFEEQAQGVA